MVEINDPTERIQSEEARNRLVGSRPWTAIYHAQETDLCMIPEVDGTMFGMSHKGGTMPVYDLKGLKKFFSIHSDAFKHFKDSPPLVHQMLAYCAERANDGELRFSGINKGVITVTSAEHPHIDPLVVFDMVIQNLGEETELDDLSISSKGVSMRFISSNAVGGMDPIQSGIHVQIKDGVTIAPYAIRSDTGQNILSTPDTLKVKALIEENYVDMILNLILSASSRSISMADNWASLIEVGVKSPKNTFVVFNRQFGLKETYVEQAVDAIRGLPVEAMMYDVVDVLNDLVARNGSKDSDLRLMGEIINTVARNAQCDSCGKIVF
jgi:hypothetical protein